MSGDHIPPPYTRQEIHRAKIISVSAVPQTIASRQLFKSSHFQGEWLWEKYVVWLGTGIVLAFVDDEWFAADLKLGNRRARDLWAAIIEPLQPTILKTKYLNTVIRHGRAGVVRRMMGLE